MKNYNASRYWIQESAECMDFLSKPMRTFLGFLSLGVAWAQSCTLSRVAGRLCFLGTVPTVERRIQYFLNNPLVDWKTGMICLSRWILSCAFKLSRRVVLLVDESALQEHLKVMVVALAYRNRAIPLAWWCYPETDYPMSQVDLIDTLLGRVAAGIPQKGVEVVVQADRGIGCSPELMHRVMRRGWYFLFRVQGSVRLKLSNGREVAFGDVVDRPGRCFCEEVKALKKSGWLQCRALGYWKVGHKEPWLLLSNWEKATTSEYAMRFWEEPAFKDLKSNGFNWQKSHVRDPEHANRLWLAMALAYSWVISLGTCALEDCRLLRQVARGNKSRLSVFRLGIMLLERLLYLNKSLPGAPHLNPEFLP